MRYVRVKITRDQNTVYNRLVPEWEVPLIEFVFEEGNVERLELFENVSADYPEPSFEFDRLTRCYGADPQSGVSYAAQVYGQAGRGIRTLERAIEEAKSIEAEAEGEKPAPKPKKSRRVNIGADSLLN